MKEIVRSCSALMSPHAYVKPLKWSLYPPSTLQSIPLYYTNWLQINIMQKETLCPSKDKYIFQPLIWVFLNKIEQCICNSKEHLCSIKLFKPAKFKLDKNGVEYIWQASSSLNELSWTDICLITHPNWWPSKSFYWLIDWVVTLLVLWQCIML